jgi:hypothetical protein
MRTKLRVHGPVVMKPKRIETVLIRWLCWRGHKHTSHRKAVRCSRPWKIKPKRPDVYAIPTFEATRDILWPAGVNCSCLDLIAFAKRGGIKYWRRHPKSPCYFTRRALEKLAASGARELVSEAKTPRRASHARSYSSYMGQNVYSYTPTKEG